MTGADARVTPTATVVETCAVIGGACLLALVSTWPLIAVFGHGARFDNNDALFGIWRMGWLARTLLTDPAHLFDANIFFPHTNTLAFSESTVALGVLAAPTYWLSGNALAAHNSVLLLAFVTSAIATYYLARHLTGSRPAAAVAAMLFADCPYVFGRISHIQLLFTAGLPMSLLATHRFMDAPSRGRGVALGCALFLTSATCGYYGVFAGLSVGFAWIFYSVSRSHWRRIEYWTGGAIAAGTWVVLMLPLYWPHSRLRQGQLARTLDDARAFSADWQSYFASSAWTHRWMLPIIERWNDILFPGFLAMTLAAVGAAQIRAKDSDVRRRETVLFYLTLAGLAVWLSFGPSAGAYTVLFYAIPLFSWMRAPSRLAVVVALSLAMLAALGLEWILRRRSRRQAAVIVTALAIATFVELAEIPLPFREQSIPAIYDTLAKLPPGAVAEFPFYSDRRALQGHTLYMFYSTRHWLPLINGYSDYIPSDYRRLAGQLESFPAADAIAALRTRGARYIVVHRNLYEPEQRAALTRALDGVTDLHPVAGDDDIALYELTRER